MKPSLPMCGVCKHPVERVVRYEDLDRRVWVFAAYCHGEMELAEITPETVEGAEGIWWTTAFQKQGDQTRALSG